MQKICGRRVEIADNHESERDACFTREQIDNDEIEKNDDDTVSSSLDGRPLPARNSAGRLAFVAHIRSRYLSNVRSPSRPSKQGREQACHGFKPPARPPRGG